MIVNAPDITLENMEIKGNLIIAEGVGEGEVKLDNVKISGDTIVKGGGENSVYFNDVTVGGALIVNKVNGSLRIVVSGSTSASVAILESGAILVTKELVGGGIEKVEVPASIAAGQNIVLQGDFKTVENNAADLEIQAKGTIENLILNKKTVITGEAKVEKVTTAEGADSVINGKSISGGKSNVSVSSTSANSGGGGSSSDTSNNNSKTYVINFDTNGGSVVEAVYAKSGQVITLPTAPTKDGYTFGAWYTDEELTKVFNASTPITADMTLYAKWIDNSAQTYAVEFDTNGGSVVDAVYAISGQVITLPTDPTKEGVTFIGWYIDEELTQEFDETMPITTDMTLYAKWSGWQAPIQIDSRFAQGYPKSSVNGTNIELKVKLIGASIDNPMEVFMVVNQMNSDNTEIDSTAVIHGHAGKDDEIIWIDAAPYIKITDENEHTIQTDVSIQGDKNVKIYCRFSN